MWYTHIVYPKKYAHGFVVLCFVVVMQSFIMNSHEVFIHIHQGCFAGTGAIVRLPQCQWSKPDGYGKTSQCITTTKHSKAKTVCIFLGIYCIWYFYIHRYVLLKNYNVRDKNTYHKVSETDRTRPGGCFQCLSLGSGALWYVIIILYFLVQLATLKYIWNSFSQLITILPWPGAHLVPHPGRGGNFDIDFLINQPVMNTDLLKHLKFTLYRQDVCIHVDILLSYVRPKLAKLWPIK